MSNYKCTCEETSRKSDESTGFGVTEITFKINPECEKHGMPYLYRELAECYKLSGADPDGDEDWRLAPRAVEEVRRMRQELDETEDKIMALSAELDQVNGELEDLKVRHTEE